MTEIAVPSKESIMEAPSFTVKDLIALLQGYPEDMIVYCPYEEGEDLVHDAPQLLSLEFQEDQQEYKFLVIFGQGANYYEEVEEDGKIEN